MKKLLIILLSIGLALGASAQRHGSTGGVRYVRPRVTVIGGYSPFSPFYGFGYGYGYGLGYYPFNAFPPSYNNRPSQLDLQIEDIRNDYRHKIKDVRHDKSLSRDERKAKIRDLKHDREAAIIDARRTYFKKSDNNS